MNLINPSETRSWIKWFPRENISPDFEITGMSGGTETTLKITANGNPGCYGVWKYEINQIVGGNLYHLSAEYITNGVDNEQTSIYAIATWLDVEGQLLQRDYLDHKEMLQDGWSRGSRWIMAPDKSALLIVEFALRWSVSGSVVWRRIKVTEEPQAAESKVRVFTNY